MKMQPTFVLSLATFGLFTCVGCQSFTSSTAKADTAGPGSTDKPVANRGPEVEVVRGGLLAGHNSATVARAFEGTFQNAKWSSLETPKGATVVQFDGTMVLGRYDTITPIMLSIGPEADTCVKSLGLGTSFEDFFRQYVGSRVAAREEIAECEN